MNLIEYQTTILTKKCYAVSMNVFQSSILGLSINIDKFTYLVLFPFELIRSDPGPCSCMFPIRFSSSTENELPDIDNGNKYANSDLRFRRDIFK